MKIYLKKNKEESLAIKLSVYPSSKRAGVIALKRFLAMYTAK